MSIHRQLLAIDPRPTRTQRKILSALLRHKRLCPANSGLDKYHLSAWCGVSVRVTETALGTLSRKLPLESFPFRLKENTGLWRLIGPLDPTPLSAPLAPIPKLLSA